MNVTRRTLLKAASISPVLFNIARAAKPTDIKIEDIRFDYQDYTYRVPIKFGGTALDRATIVNVNITVSTRDGRRIAEVHAPLQHSESAEQLAPSLAHVGPPGTTLSTPTLIAASAAKKLPSAHIAPYAMSPSVLDIRTRKTPDTSSKTMMNMAITVAMPRSSVQGRGSSRIWRASIRDSEASRPRRGYRSGRADPARSPGPSP